METKRIAVLYLCRYANPPQASRKFLKSLMRFRAGADFELVYLLKGFPEGATDPALSRLKNRLPCPVSEVRVSDEFFMINALLEGAAQIPHEFIFPLSSWSYILADNWLGAFVSAFERVTGCVAAGATGSCDGSFIKRDFSGAHLRTTAFLINRKTFLALERGRLRTKIDNNHFESGPNGMTRQLLAKGGKVVVVGKDGRCWLPEEWPQSRTFFSGQQENLLIADNQTQLYEGSKYYERRNLARLAYGDEHLAQPPGFVRRVRRFFQETKKKLRRSIVRRRQRRSARVSEAQVAMAAATDLYLLQDPADFTEFVTYLANHRKGASLALDIGIASGSQVKFLRDFFPIAETIIVDSGLRPEFPRWEKLRPLVKTKIILEIIGDSRSREVYDRLQPYAGRIDFVFIGGDQSFAGLMRDLKLAHELCAPGALFVLNGTKAIPDCRRVFQWLCTHPDFELLQNFDHQFGIGVFRCLIPKPLQPFSSHEAAGREWLAAASGGPEARQE